MSEINNLKPVQKLKPFTHFCMTIGNLPSSYLESMTYYEQIVWFIKFLEDTVIPTINNNSEAVQELQRLYIELKNFVDNYFENLDVQEEINNKLDEMAEQGTLQEIITSYLNSKALFCYDNVQNMKEATNLINGSYAKTLGFYNKNDGGSSIYKIRNITNSDVIDNMTIIPVSNNLIAELIYFNEISILQLGAKENVSNFDNHDIILKALNIVNVVIIPKGNFYTSALSLQGLSNKKIKGNGSVANWSTNSKLTFISDGIGLKCSDNLSEVPSWSAKAIEIEGLQIDGNNVLNTGINCNYDVNIKDCVVLNCLNDGIILEGQSYPVKIENVTVRNCKGNGCHIKSPYTTVYNLLNCEFSANDKYGLLIEGGSTSSIINVLCQANKTGGIKIFKPNSANYNRPVYLDKLIFINCYTEANGTLSQNDENYEGNYALYANTFNGENNTLYANKIDYLTFINCSFNHPQSSAKGAELNACSFVSSINNTYLVNNSYYQTLNNTLFANSYNSLNNDNISKYTEKIYQPSDNTAKTFKYSNGFIGKVGQYKTVFSGPVDDTSLKCFPQVQYLQNGVMISSKSLLLGLNIRLANQISTGSLKVQVKWGYATYNTLSTVLHEETLTSASNTKTIREIFKRFPDSTTIVAITLEKSEDFALSNSNFNGIEVDLITSD